MVSTNFLKKFAFTSFWLVTAITSFGQQMYDQLPECSANVPYFELDLSANPNLSFTTPEFNRQPGCCGNNANNDDYVSFYVTLHPDVAMFELIVAPGYADPPGAGIYNIVSGDMITGGTCGVDIPGGAPVCITGSGPHKITYLKPGNNKIKYIFRQIPKPIYPADQPTRLGCTLPLPIYGLNNIAITAIAKSGNLSASLATCNTYLSCLDCEDLIFEPGSNATYPYTITYQVTGTPKAAVCGSYPASGTFTVTVYDALNISVNPAEPTFCSDGAGVNLTALASGGDGNYSFQWLDSDGNVLVSDNVYLADTMDIFTAEVMDGLVTTTCPAEYISIPVVVADPPIAYAGLDQTACASNPTVTLTGNVDNADPEWLGGAGTFSPDRYAEEVTYTPTAGEIASGSVTLTLKSINIGGGCDETTDEVTIFYSSPISITETIGSIVCYGQTTTITTSVSGGIPAYTYEWTTGSSLDNITVSSGTYGLTVTDQYSCSVTEYYTVNEPAPINLVTSSVDENAGGDGSVSITISGGDAPYSVDWTDEFSTPISSSVLSVPPYTDNVSPLGYGIYTSTVTDGNGCSVASSVVVNTFACSGLSVNVSSTDADCYGNSTGSATAAPFGGVGPYTYEWNGNPLLNSATITNLPAGIYTVEITDVATSCIDVASVAVFQPVQLTNTMTQTDVMLQGGSDGTATANPLGGTPVYTYSWSTTPTQSAQSATTLMAGTYSVDITDFNGCMITDEVYINEPPCNDFLLAVNTGDLLCNGDSDGTANLYITGGQSPFNIAWSNGDNDVMSIGGLSAGNYSVDVTDFNGCFTTRNFTITEPDAISLGLSPTNVTCFGASNGTIDLTVTGGTYPQYTYSWWSAGKEIATHQDLVSLPPGTYSITVTDENGCTATGSIGITQPTKIQTSYTYTDNLCNGQSVGSVDATITGGILPYSYSWVGPSGYTASTQDITGLATGLYTLNVTDGNNCQSAPMQAYIYQPELLTSSAVMTAEVTCAAGNDGAAELTVNGGTEPYSFAWTGSSAFTATTQNITDLAAGTYNVTVTDYNGCSTNTSVIVTTVQDVTDPVITCGGNQSVNTSSSSCQYTHSGTAWNATATDNCVVASVTYNLTGATSGTGTSLNGVAFNLGTTTVTWTATDGLGNTDVCQFDVTVTDVIAPTVTSCASSPQNVNVDAGECNFTQTSTAWDATATDNCTVSSITAVLTGATTGTGLTTLNGVDFNLGTTTVTWTVTDGVGNTSTCVFNVIVTDNIAPTLTACVGSTQNVNVDAGECNYTQTTTAWDATATDNCTVSSITAVLTGATTGSGLTTLNGIDFNLGTTTVTWTVTDGVGNTSTCVFNVIVTDNIAPTLTACVGSTQNVNVDEGQCNYTQTTTAWDATTTDNCTVSSITAVLTGATTGSGLTTLNGVDFNLGTTTVTWTVTDGAGNTSTCVFNVVVTDNILPVITTCGAVGNQSVNANTGLCTYTHPNNSWNASTTDNCTVTSLIYTLTGATTGTGTTLSGETFNLGVTTVTWTATDVVGNISTCSFNVTVNDAQNPIITSCGAIGNQSVLADAGQCNYTQTSTAWDASATDNCSLTSLIYTLTGATTGSGTSLQNVDFNLGTTTVTWTATDGTGNTSTCSFNVTVTDNQLPVIVNCGAGAQTVSTDAGQCTFTNNGTAWDATATDNCTVSSLTYVLSGATTESGTTLDGVVFNIGTTTVTWTVTDNSGNSSTCNYTILVEDNEFPAIVGCPIDITVSNDASSCGAIVSWTVPSYTDNCGATMVSSHDPGDYFAEGTTTVTYTVTDNSGNITICTFDVTVNDTEIPAITCNPPVSACDPIVTYSAPITADNCGIASVIQTAGLASGVSYPVGVTTNTFEVTDIHGNINTCSFDIEVFALPVITLSPTDVSCFGFNDASIDATITSGTAPFTFSWSNSDITEDISGLAPGSYTLLVTDDNGCTDTETTSVNQPTQLIVDYAVDHVNCFNGTNGSVDLTVSGGLLPYTFNWTNGATTEDLSNLSIGDYDVTVSDLNGCSVFIDTAIVQPDSLMLQSSSEIATCEAANGSIQVLVTGGTTPYSYSWSHGATSLNLNNTVAGIYTLTVTDALGCQNMITDTIGSSSNLAATTIIRDVLCYGGSDGEIQVIVESGNGPYTYEWTNGESSDLITDLSSGSYSVTVTDIFGCTTIVNSDVNQPDSMYYTVDVSQYVSGDNISVWGAQDGSIEVEVFGGEAPYNYLWEPYGYTTQDLSNLSSGTYTLIVTDQNGCRIQVRVTLTQPDDLMMPQGFSPNGDGDNEIFDIHGIDSYPDNEFTVYNRWGNIVYSLEDYQNEWDGTNNVGEPLPEATYFAVLTVFTGEGSKTLTGYVDLRR